MMPRIEARWDVSEMWNVMDCVESESCDADALNPRSALSWAGLMPRVKS